MASRRAMLPKEQSYPPIIDGMSKIASARPGDSTSDQISPGSDIFNHSHSASAHISCSPGQAQNSALSRTPIQYGTACLSELPAYIQPSQREFDAEELDYLKRRGALSVPEPCLRDQLLLSVLMYVYPSLPVLDLQDLFNAIDGKPGCQISLILFQAIMFSGTAFVDLQLLLDAGFENRLAARTHFFKKIKLLYDFEWERDRVVLIQATLLHAWWYTSTNDQHDPWYWLGIAIALAAGIGLNDPGTHSMKENKMRRLWRRMWWTIVSRDRTMSVITRKPMLIRDGDLNLPLPKFTDFDTQPLVTNIAILRDSPVVIDCVSKVMLADMFMSHLNLLLITGRIVTSFYVVQGFAALPSEWAMYYRPKRKRDIDPVRLRQLGAEVETWATNLNSYCQVGFHQDDETDKHLKNSLRVHAASLKLLHLMAQEILHRPLTSPSQSRQRSPSLRGTDRGTDSSDIEPCKAVSTVAREMSNLFRDLRQDNLLECLPPLSVGCLVTAIAAFVVEIRLSRKLPADVPGHQYHECIRCLISLQDVWPITKGTLKMVKGMETNNQIWYARTLKMLAEPAAGSSDEMSTTNDHNASEHPRGEQTQVVEGNLPETTNSRTQIMSGDQQFDPGWDGQIAPATSYCAPFLESMYPFPWFSADFDAFDDEDAARLFTDYPPSSFDVGGDFASDLSGCPSTISPNLQESAHYGLTLSRN